MNNQESKLIKCCEMVGFLNSFYQTGKHQKEYPQTLLVIRMYYFASVSWLKSNDKLCSNCLSIYKELGQEVQEKEEINIEEWEKEIEKEKKEVKK